MTRTWWFCSEAYTRVFPAPICKQAETLDTQRKSHTLPACAEDREGEAAGGVAAAGVAAAGVTAAAGVAAAGVAAGDDSAQTVASSSMHGGLLSGLLFREERLPTNTVIPY